MIKNTFPSVDLQYQGSSMSYYFFALVTMMSTFRSLVHIFRSDGGATTIARIPTNVEGGQNIKAIFGQWGAS